MVKTTVKATVKMQPATTYEQAEKMLDKGFCPGCGRKDKDPKMLGMTKSCGRSSCIVRTMRLFG